VSDELNHSVFAMFAMKLAVRTAVPDDEPVFVQAEVLGWQYGYRYLLPASYLHGGLREERVEFWRARFGSGRLNQWLAVAQAYGKVVGVVCAYSALPETNGECYIAELYILPAYKRQGVGKKLVAAAAAWCEDRGSKSLCLTTITENTDAVDFYVALGGLARVGKPWVPTCGGQLAVVEFLWPEIGSLSQHA
jgi:ribosomal protein S18 acetylase RimI-like enzyme